MQKTKLTFLAAGLFLAGLVFLGCSGRVVISDTQPPTVQILSPADGAVLSGDTVFVTASATDNKGIAKVEFYVDGGLVFADSSSPYVFPWLILIYNDSTQHTLLAKSYDAAGNTDTNSIAVMARVAPGFHFISSTATSAVSYYNLFVWGNYVAVAEQGNGVEIFDISNPAIPRFLSSYNAGGGSANGVFVSNNYLYVAYGQEGVHVLDVSDPSAPFFKSSLTLPGFADVENIFIKVNYAFLAAKNAGMYILNISNPDSLVQLGQYNTGSGIAYDVKVVDTLAYIAYGGSGLEIVNIKDTLSPPQVGKYIPAGVVRRLAISGNRAYLAMQNAGVDIVNISNPASPSKLENYNTFNSFFTGVAVDGFKAYLANRDDGVQIVDVTNPANPFSVAFYNTEGLANNLVFRNSFVYLADQSSLTVLRYIP